VGAAFGDEAIPAHWLASLGSRDAIEQLAADFVHGVATNGEIADIVDLARRFESAVRLFITGTFTPVPGVRTGPVTGCAAVDDRLGSWRSASANIRSPRSAGSRVLL
jgi:hypothetical protein